jgi:hypothetical protein
MDFVENDPCLPESAEKGLGIGQSLGNRWKVTVEIDGIRDALREDGFAHAPDPRKPGNGGFLPGIVYFVLPEWSIEHENRYYI